MKKIIALQKKRFLKTGADYRDNIKYYASVIRISRELYIERKSAGENIDNRRIRLIVNHLLRDLQMMFGWEYKGKTKYRECFFYASRDVYIDFKRQEQKEKIRIINEVTQDHVIPVNIRVDEILGDLSSDSSDAWAGNADIIRAMMDPVALITKKENDTLNDNGLKSSCPNMDIPFSRYDSVNIPIITLDEGEQIDCRNFTWIEHYKKLSNTQIIDEIFREFEFRIDN